MNMHLFVLLSYFLLFNDSYQYVLCTGNNCVAKDNFPLKMFDLKCILLYITLLLLFYWSWSLALYSVLIKQIKDQRFQQSFGITVKTLYGSLLSLDSRFHSIRHFTSMFSWCIIPKCRIFILFAVFLSFVFSHIAFEDCINGEDTPQYVFTPLTFAFTDFFHLWVMSISLLFRAVSLLR